MNLPLSKERTEAQPPERIVAVEEAQESPTHPEARGLFKSVPCMRCVPIFGDVVAAFGPKCVISLGTTEFLVKGVADNIIRYSLFPMFTYRFMVEAKTYQRMSSMVSLGYAIKPLAAMISDIFSLFGYTKRWYLLISCILGSVTAVIYGSLPANSSSVPVAAVLVFLTSFSKAQLDILTQGHYTRLMRRIPDAGSALVSWVWWGILLGTVTASCLVGPLTDNKLQHVAVYVAAAVQIMPTVFFILNWYGERRNREDRLEDYKALHGEQGEASTHPMEPSGNDDSAPSPLTRQVRDNDGSGSAADRPPTEDAMSTSGGPRVVPCCKGVFEMNEEVFRHNKLVVLCCGFLTLGTISLVVATIFGSRTQLLYTSVTISFLLCSFAFYALTPVIAKANLYTFISRVAYVQIPGAIDNFYMAKPDCVPDGPHFSYFYYNTVGNIIGTAGGIVGVTMFRYFFSKRSYRLTFVMTTVIEIMASIFELIIVERWNRPHVSDKVVFVLGDQIIQQVCYMMHLMPTLILLSRLAPRGSESMVYALLAGFAHFGRSISNTIGSLLMEFVWPVRSDISKGPCDFSNLKWLLIVGHFICPLVSVPLVFVLLPKARICDVLDVDGKAVKKQEDDKGVKEPVSN
ncbi:putative pteridine transporter [Trypanosoma vivax]|uniref:Folate/pteridine transporter putative n=1 Tax=Trypanosoma vivax (strain Y486) TaxID=1055687 RepID=G0U0U4_TRYVY|nr:putative folate/pteridine transporter [Trypanosoma vivax]KAH8608197.1 putative pteridine transporter [Trypanosoma vivax]CCC49695.1 folate/pteridine transporter putative [Trypanosoma vivax Y486]